MANEFGEDVQVAQLTLGGIGSLIKQGNDVKKTYDDGKKLGEKTGIIEKEQGKKTEQKAGAGDATLTVVTGEGTPLTPNVEKWMKEHNLKVKENGILSQDEANTLGKALTGKKDLVIHLDNNRDVTSIEFTKKSLGALDIDLPVSGKTAPAASAPSAAASEPSIAEKGKKMASDAADAGMSAWDKMKQKAAEAANALTKCTVESNPEYNSQACVQQRADQKARSERTPGG